MKIRGIILGAIAALAVANGASTAANAGAIGMGTNYWYTDTLANNLIAQGNTVSVVNSYDATSLSAFNVYIQDGNSYFDPTALLSFVQNGGTLIELPWSLEQNYNYSGALQLMGRSDWSSVYGPNPAIDVLNGASPLLAGVTLPGAGAYTVDSEADLFFVNPADGILQWSGGDALLGEAQVGLGHVIAFNLHMITSDSLPLNAPWNDQIIYNAIAQQAGGDAVPEPVTLVLLGSGLLGLGAARRRKVAI